MAYNMTSFQPIRDLLREIGGEEAAKTMPTPTFSVCVNEKGQMLVRVTAGEVIGCQLIGLLTLNTNKTGCV